MMKAHTGNSAHRLGLWAGRVWRGVLRQEPSAVGWMGARGVPAGVARLMLLSAKLLVLGALLYAAFWLALLVVAVFLAARAAESSKDWDDIDFMNRKAEEQDHRQSLFYDPINFNDDPDPRFDDD
ncbi:DUF3742 family protein [Pseudomonas aeruginosa]|nr:DUF3742 family protein [Pseudomonas aeruginosa]HBO0859735.1 DUF3742 family protein [Pseudomonas aeruginosa]HCE6879287.1 DUF3742 family protein [Pseudomonas aeruginosa]HDR2971093.1 DUF3742 family protein [Pseudomonas aeruginosa]